MLNNRTILFPALSVGSHLSVMRKDTPHFLNGGSFRFGRKDSLFHYPYILVSAAHGFKDMEFKKNIEFDGLFFGDSGGFQLWAGSAHKDYNKEVAMDWLNNNAQIFPIIDIPPSKDKGVLKVSVLEECAKKSLENAKYFQKNKLKGKLCLNVLQGRNSKEIDIWYNIIRDVELEGWAFAGINFIQIATAFFYLLEKGELQRAKIFHIFGVTRPRYIIFMTYLQRLLNERDINCRITYDSSYPFRTSAFGTYFLLPSMEGIRNLKFTNTIQYDHLSDSTVLPCDCPYCKDVPIKEFAKFSSERFYAISSAHNLYVLIKYKKYIESMTNLGCDYLLSESFKSEDWNIMKILKRYMEEDVPYKAPRVEKALEPFFKYELDDQNADINELF